MLDLTDLTSDFNCFDPTATYSPSQLPDTTDCMRCGVCLTSCPTYLLTQNEAESPRSRVRSLTKLVLNHQSLSAAEQQHLSHCLQCLACETVCPSQMAYEQVFIQAQQQLVKAQNWRVRLAFQLIKHKTLRRFFVSLALIYLRSGLQKPLQASGLLHKLGLARAEHLLQRPSLIQLPRINSTKKSKPRGRVALFTGCLAEHFDKPVQLAAIKLLNALGFDVVVPNEQVCCGALHWHHGQDPTELVAKNTQVFYDLEVDAVLYSASACGANLKKQLAADQEMSGWLSRHLLDINDFLLQNWPDNLQLAASKLTVAVHEPCSQRNQLKNQQNLYALLAKIPHLQSITLSNNQQCCGAGGSYMLEHPQTADQLRELKRRAIANSAADLVVSSNFGCRYFLHAGQNQPEYKLFHPIQLLADRL